VRRHSSVGRELLQQSGRTYVIGLRTGAVYAGQCRPGVVGRTGSVTFFS
jgi:hypothetical protein